MVELLLDIEGDHDDALFEGLTFGDLTVRGADYNACVFRKCTFESTRFDDCRFDDCVFDDCNLVGARFPQCTFNDTSFEGGRVMGASFVDVQSLVFDLRFHNVRLDYTNFDTLPMAGFEFRGCSMKETRLEGCGLRSATFVDCDLSGALIAHADLTGATFSNTRGCRIATGSCTLSDTSIDTDIALLALHDLGLRCPDLEQLLGVDAD